MTSRCQGLFAPHPFFDGKALRTRLMGLQTDKILVGYYNSKLNSSVVLIQVAIFCNVYAYGRNPMMNPLQ